MQNILIVTDAKSHLLISLKERLRVAAYGVLEVPANTNAIHGIKEPVSGMLIYAGETLVQNLEALYFIKDKAIMDNIPIFVIGEQGEISTIEAAIPKTLIELAFVRPINVRLLAEKIDDFMQHRSSQNRKKILVVDDSGAALRDAKGWLEGKYDVFLVNSAAMTIKYLTLNRPDLVLLDYEMPVCDGRQVLEMIRAEKDFADIPVIFLTNKGDTGSVRRAMELQPEGYLLKTLDPEKIVKAVDDFFDRSKALIS